MIPYSACVCVRGSGDKNNKSTWQIIHPPEAELKHPQRRTSGVQRSVSSCSSVSGVATEQQEAAAAAALYIRMIGPGPSSAAPVRSRCGSLLTDADWLLLEGLDTRRQRPLHTGRFLTMHKRRRRRLVTRGGSAASLGGGGPALLDDVLHGQVQCVLDRVCDWPFNAFILDTVTGALIEEGYHGTNPYHNAIHAADVTQAMHCFLQEKKNTSVLENHHWRSAVGCLLESCVAEQLGPHREALEQQISSLILATDITRQQEFITRFKIALKCADISNPCRPWDISKKWSQKVCEEFFRQGDYERRLNLPVTSLCDRHTTSVPKIQAEWQAFLVSPLAMNMMTHLRENQTRWEALLSSELAEETKTEVSEAADDIDDEELAQLEAPAQTLAPPVSSVGRRHSVPLSVPRLPVARTIIRRESLPTHPVGGYRFPSETILHIECSEEESSTVSLFSDQGSGSVRSLGPPQDIPRPLSADTLLPESSIASITTTAAATRLSSVLHPSGPGGRCLTRQQTFPPLHPSMHAAAAAAAVSRMRCQMPGTASEALRETSDSTSSSSSCHTENTRELAPKREPPAVLERNIKMAKLEGKENRAPSEKCALRTKPAQGLTRLQCRRGSAPVGLCKLDVSPPVEYRLSRRGSVPSVLRALAPASCMPRRASLPYDPTCAVAAAAVAASVTPNLVLSLPSHTLLQAEVPEAGWVTQRRKMLRRRFSAGGPDREPHQPSGDLLAKRRGSLPAELSSHAGCNRASANSSSNKCSYASLCC
ncbi:hypothetical protein B566_EDAN009113 [Ephemera danica]|nr:hypothetical protein B566_EDAN009113 [Ephemera danica]